MAFMTPLVGASSDRCTSRFGRRRPFIAIGAAATVASLIAFSYAEVIGDKLGDSGDNHTKGILVTWVALWALNLAGYAAYGVQRTSLTDLTPTEWLPVGNACLAANNGLGKMLAYGLGSLCLVVWLPWSLFDTQLQALFATAAVYLAATAILTVVFATEQPWRPDPLKSKAPSGCCTVADQVREAIKHLPTPVKRVFPSHMCSGFAWYSISVYESTWLAEQVYGGTPSTDAGLTCGDDEDAYSMGVQRASQGFLIMAAISTVWGPVIPKLYRRLGVRLVWACHLLVFAMVLLLMPLVKEGQHTLEEMLLGLLGFPLAATSQVPWSVVTAACRRAGHEEQRGVIIALYSMCTSLSSVVLGVCTACIVSAYGENPAVGLFLSGIGVLCGVGLCYFVEDPQVKDPIFPSRQRPGAAGHLDSPLLTGPELYGKMIKLPERTTVAPPPAIQLAPFCTVVSAREADLV